MVINAEQTKKLLLGNYVFSQLGFSLLITRLKGVYSKNQDHATLMNCVGEINAFLDKYSIIMDKDFEIISKL